MHAVWTGFSTPWVLCATVLEVRMIDFDLFPKRNKLIRWSNDNRSLHTEHKLSVCETSVPKRIVFLYFCISNSNKFSYGVSAGVSVSTRSHRDFFNSSCVFITSESFLTSVVR
jgi:hypothetical protein